MAGYYDLILGLIPLALLGISVVLHVGGVAVTAAVSVAGLVTTALIAHAMFVRTPVRSPPPETTSSAVSQTTNPTRAD